VSDKVSRKSGLRSGSDVLFVNGSGATAAGLGGGDGKEGGRSGGSHAQSFSDISDKQRLGLTCWRSKIAFGKAFFLCEMEPHLSSAIPKYVAYPFDRCLPCFCLLDTSRQTLFNPAHGETEAHEDLVGDVDP
jgi:hypothetical protein